MWGSGNIRHWVQEWITREVEKLKYISRDRERQREVKWN